MDVSVVIPCFNAGATLERAVGSVHSEQSVREIIVSDDGSSDTSEAIATAAGGKVRFMAGRNSGASSARNRGIAASAAPFILFLDADDYVDVGYIDGLLTSATSITDIVLGSYRRVSTGGNVTDQVVYPERINPREALALYLCHPTQTGAFLWRRAFLEAIGGWDESLLVYQDAELSMRGLLQASVIQICSNHKQFAYWCDNDSECRISHRFTREKSLSTLYALNRHRDAIVALHSDEATLGLATRYYSLARLSFIHGHFYVGELALREYRGLGFAGHQGSAAHRVGCFMFGLSGKTRISQTLVRAARGWSTRRRTAQPAALISGDHTHAR